MIAQRAARTPVLALVMTIALALILCGCKGDDTPDASSALPAGSSKSNTEPAPPAENTPDAAPILSPLTGLVVEDEDYDGNQRPIAVVVGNRKQDRPQRGLAKAEVVYEIMEKNGTTDLMALYPASTRTPKVGPVTAAQDAFAQFAIAQNAIFTHTGGTVYTENLLNELAYQDLDGVYLGRTAFTFDNERTHPRPGGKLNEACWFTDKRLIAKGIKKAGVTATAEMTPLFRFTPDAPAPSRDAEEIKIVFPKAKSGFLYNADAGIYTKMLGKKAHADENGKTLTFNNVLLLNCTTADKEGDAHNLDYDLRGGEGYYFNAGNVQKITWRKGGPQDPLKLYDARNNELAIQTGTSYIGLLNQDTELSYGQYTAE